MLRKFLFANCVSCAIFGGLFLLIPSQSASFVGTPPPIVMGTMGLLLAINAVLLALTILRWSHIPSVILFFVLGDAGWVVLTLVCLFFGFWIEGSVAVAASIVVAVFVGGLGYGQYLFGVKHSAQPRV